MRAASMCAEEQERLNRFDRRGCEFRGASEENLFAECEEGFWIGREDREVGESGGREKAWHGGWRLRKEGRGECRREGEGDADDNRKEGGIVRVVGNGGEEESVVEDEGEGVASEECREELMDFVSVAQVSIGSGKEWQVTHGGRASKGFASDGASLEATYSKGRDSSSCSSRTN